MFWVHSLTTMSFGIIGLFIPIYLLTKGYSLTQVLLFMAWGQLAALVTQTLSMRIVGKIGANHAMVIGNILLVLYFAMLPFISHFGSWWLFVALPGGFSRAIYWGAFHANFSKARAHKRSSKQIGLLYAVLALVTGLAPAIGGVIASTTTITITYVAAAILMLIASIPLLGNHEIVKRRSLNMAQFKWKKYRSDMIGNGGNGMLYVADSIVWPLAVYVFISSYVGVGILSSVVTIGATTASLYVGWREQRKGVRHFLWEGYGFINVASFIRLLAQNGLHVFGANLFTGVGKSLYVTPFMDRYYRHADESPRYEYIAAVEMAHETAALLFLLLLVILSLFVPAQAIYVLGISCAIPAGYLMTRIR
jgi:MFS family permease